MGNNHLPKVSACDVEQLLRNIDSKKSTGTDKIPPKLTKLSAKVLSKPEAIAINNSFNKGIFPDNAEIACVSLLDKHTSGKYSVTNFPPVSVLNTFSKNLWKNDERLSDQQNGISFFTNFWVAKRDAYGFSRDTVAYIYSYLKNRKQCVRINGTQSYLGDIISDVPRDQY